MGDHIGEANEMVVEQAARVIAETQMRLVNERNATLAREGLWPDHHFSATPKQLAQALHDAGLLAKKPVDPPT